MKTDVTQWTDLSNVFKETKEKYGRIDHVFANAGINGRANYLNLQTDPESGEPLEPSHGTYDVNLKAVVNTVSLAVHYMQQQDPKGGSIVATGSASSFQPFRETDYGTTKHGVLGFMRGLNVSLKHAGLPIRINVIAPSWTVSGLLPAGMVEMTGVPSQSASVIARATAFLMADHSRTGEMIYAVKGQYFEVEKSVLLPAVKRIVKDEPEDLIFERLMKILTEQGMLTDQSQK